MTDYLFRVLLIVPSDRKAGLDAFIAEEFDSAKWLVVELSSTGTVPATQYATCFACTYAQSTKWAERLTTEGGVPLPPGFATMTPDERIQFMEAARPTLKQLTGVIVDVCRNDQQWYDVEDILHSEGLKRIGQDIP